MVFPFTFKHRNGVLRVDRVRSNGGNGRYYRQVLQVNVSSRVRRIYNGQFFMFTPKWAD